MAKATSKPASMTDQARKLGAKHAPGPRVVEASEAPQGRRLSGNLGAGTLYPGVGKLVQRSGQPTRCGTISGIVFGYNQHANSIDATRQSTRFAGQFMAVNYRGEIIQGYECYFPGTVERSLRAALDLRTPGADPLRVSVEIWAEPDEEGRPPSQLGWSYRAYDRMAQGTDDPLMALAYEAGILERPAARLTDDSQPRPGERIDPETGEVLPDAPQAA